MKRKIGIVLAVMLVVACLVGCAGGGLTDADFKAYDEDGKVTKQIDDDTFSFGFEEGEMTHRKIKLGSTEEEFKKAYEDILELARFSGGYIWEREGKKLIIGFDEGGKVDSILISTQALSDSSTFYSGVVHLTTSPYNSDEELIACYETWVAALTEEEKEIINVLGDRATHNKYDIRETFMGITMLELDDVTWLTDEQKKLAKSAYEKFKENITQIEDAKKKIY